MIFVVTTFSLFYFTYLYNFLYVNEFTSDTGGLAFPIAIHQTMTGIYFGEICLIGLFFISPGARAQGVVMVVVLVITVLFQIQLSKNFDPLITYLPIDIQEELAGKVQEQRSEDGQKPADDEESKGVPEMKSVGNASPGLNISPQLGELEFESPESSKSGKKADVPEPVVEEADVNMEEGSESRWYPSIRDHVKRMNEKIPIPGFLKKKGKEDEDDGENVDTTLSRKFAHELTHDELTAIAFQHEALRARPPILWIPDDELGIAKDEIRHTKLECGDEINITCKGATLDSNGKIVWLDNPPDYVPPSII